MVFGVRGKGVSTKAAKPSTKAAAAGGQSNHKKGTKKTSGVTTSSASTMAGSTATGGTKQTRVTLGIKPTKSSKLARSESSSRVSSRASIASSIGDDREDREGAGAREQASTGSKSREKSSVLDQELVAIETDTDLTLTKNTAEEETAPYGGLEDKYAQEDDAPKDPALDPNTPEQAEDEEDEDSVDEEMMMEKMDEEHNGGDEEVALDPTEAAEDGHTDGDAVDKHHRSPKSQASKMMPWKRGSNSNSNSNNNEREHPQERKENESSSKSGERTPRSAARSTSRSKNRSKNRSRPKDTDAYDDDGHPKSKFKKKVEEGVEEVQGTTQDILLSVFQVCCAFALRGKEINGFVREIDNARAELR